MTHGSLFSGIGGFDLAAEWMGWENLFHCERNPTGQKVLHHYWPNAEQFTDITKSNFTKYANRIDVLTGGFPCQPYSVAGKRLGKDDERHLWPEMLRAIREIQPRYVVGENVSGLVSWNGGLVFDEVQTDLEAAGYKVIPFVLPAAGVDAPHRRDRVWFVAYANDKGGSTGLGQVQRTHGEVPQRNHDAEFGNASNQPTPDPDSDGHELRGFAEDRPAQVESEADQQERKWIRNHCGRTGESGIATDTDSQRHGKLQFATFTDRPQRQHSETGFTGQPPGWQNFPTQSPVCSRNDGLPNRLDGITFSKWRNESIKAYGNAIVPQVAFQIFKAIQEFENQLT